MSQLVAKFCQIQNGDTIFCAESTESAEDIELETDIPLFATSNGPIQFSGKSVDADGEHAMMGT